ncbi:Cytochrome c553 [Nitrosomonas cryotolerans]|uniref:Cytochrome c553 n=1 Tax=Nitrosomonas cryotolerans ATCC 49181 TaxID=1131553 RepID=A0A1N6H2A1_9PROT|nr:cytochrome c553 [Nitrosomonas cryotolerans]SFQ07074.1 Cytochrome c553 [Nitrosomonas cryotolerans]SIO13805.1 Cytochrome c553 [Nitrosomonas cryotolerans ATCC 49181]
MMHFIAILFFLMAFVANAAGVTSAEVPDTMTERVKACTICHGDEDRVSQDIYYPRIAGKPEGYLFNQLRNFRDGRRYYEPMAMLLENMSDEYMLEIARYFASLQLPYPPPEQISMKPAEVKLAEDLIHSGDSKRDIPACRACHGHTLMGREPFIPGLLGLSRTYITAQLGGWRNGGLMRGQVADCMSEIAKRLTDEETNALAKWLATQPVLGKSDLANGLSLDLMHRCSSLVMENGGAIK